MEKINLEGKRNKNIILTMNLSCNGETNFVQVEKLVNKAMNNLTLIDDYKLITISENDEDITDEALLVIHAMELAELTEQDNI